MATIATGTLYVLLAMAMVLGGLIVLSRANRRRNEARRVALAAPARRLLLAIAAGDGDPGQLDELVRLPGPVWTAVEPGAVALLGKVRGDARAALVSVFERRGAAWRARSRLERADPVVRARPRTSSARWAASTRSLHCVLSWATATPTSARSRPGRSGPSATPRRPGRCWPASRAGGAASRLVALPYFVVFELLAPLVELGGLVLVPLGLYLNAIDVAFAIRFALMAYGYAMLVNLAALAVEEFSFHRYGRWRDLVAAVVASVLENVGYRQLTTWWRMRGSWAAIRRGKQVWGVMHRTGFGGEEPVRTTPSRVDARKEAAR
jgi:hypothetical protein